MIGGTTPSDAGVRAEMLGQGGPHLAILTDTGMVRSRGLSAVQLKPCCLATPVEKKAYFELLTHDQARSRTSRRGGDGLGSIFDTTDDSALHWPSGAARSPINPTSIVTLLFGQLAAAPALPSQNARFLYR
jgi:hypothetical protein